MWKNFNHRGQNNLLWQVSLCTILHIAVDRRSWRTKTSTPGTLSRRLERNVFSSCPKSFHFIDFSLYMIDSIIVAISSHIRSLPYKQGLRDSNGYKSMGEVGWVHRFLSFCWIKKQRFSYYANMVLGEVGWRFYVQIHRGRGRIWPAQIGWG